MIKWISAAYTYTDTTNRKCTNKLHPSSEVAFAAENNHVIDPTEIIYLRRRLIYT